MSRVYDNWERLVEATLKRDQLRQIALCPSLSSSSSIDFSSIDSSSIDSSLDSLDLVNGKKSKETKTLLKNLQKFAVLRHDKREQNQSIAHDELARATQDINDMRDCYDRLLSAAAATANSVYEFSESLREMGDCLLEKTALNDDEESGIVWLKLGKVQFELQKLVDGYRAHILQTITIPSESLLNEFRIVEEMKKRCDGKRKLYEDLIKKQKEKGRLKGSKNESLPLHQLQEAYDEYDEEARMFVFRMESLKQGQSRSLLTQASRHHAAQLSFFKKALRSLEAVEPHVRLVAEQQHIDYQFSGLKDDGGGDSDTEDGSETHDEGELSFDNGQIGPVQESSALKSSMEEILPSPGRNSFSFRREIRAISKSAPLFPEKKLDSTQMRSSPSRKFNSYVLPTPDETKSPVRKSDNEAPQTRQAAGNLWHLSPLDLNKYDKLQANEKFSGPIILDTKSVLEESNNTKPTQLPPPLSQGLSFKQYDPSVASHANKVKRQAFSGPLTGKPWPNNPGFSASGPIVSSGYPPPFSGSLLRTPLPRPTSAPKLSARLSPTYVSSPKISELHEHPRPPPHLASRRPSNRSTHSGPLMSKSNEMTAARVSACTVASTLPTPPQVLPRSYSVPAGGPIEVSLRVPLEGSSKMADDTSSPPYTNFPTKHPTNVSYIIGIC